MSSRFPTEVITVEIAPKFNRQLMCEFLGERLRGRWSMAAIPGQSSETMSGMPDLAGIRLTLDCRKRTLVKFDPMGDEDHKDALDRAKRILSGWGSSSHDPHPTVTRDKLSDNDLKSILHEFCQWRDHAKVIVIAGDIPDTASIDSLPGRRRINPWDTGSRQERYEPAAEPAAESA